jgi:SAM-dependent methyltransferase
MLLYAATISLSSFLLFLIQPILAKQILPWFGGSAAVWTTCLVFFQFVLLFGYAYADWTSRRLSPRLHTLLHMLLLLLSLAFLPVLADPAWKPLGNEDPALRILTLLAVTVGLPYFLLSSTGPLIQAWFARSFANRTPYRLFALSNFASMLGLLIYPFGIEPRLRLQLQSSVWSIAYGVFVLLCIASAWQGLRALPVASPRADIASADEPAPTATERAAWLIFAALGSFLLLAVTNHVCLNIASIPFLWVLPLALYLLSFILCFDGGLDGKGWYRRGLFFLLTGAVLVPMAGFLQSSKLTLDLKLAIPVYLAGLFVCCMFCHGELAARKPAPRHLTGFYLMVSLGGALGALLVGVLAAHLLSGYYELGFGLLLVALLLLFQLRRAVPPYIVAGVIVAGFVAVSWVIQIEHYAAETRLKMRNFYGSLRTWDTVTSNTHEPMRKFVHGVILHGEQFLEPKKRDLPTSYYSATSGVGRALKAFDKPNLRVGLIGLGAGTLAAYGRGGDYYRIYEINPLVVDTAQREFTYLADCKAHWDIVLGDARLNLEKEAAQNFDLLVIDAFSGDAIPAHLITREAVAIYRRHLRDGGVLAFHVTNRYLDLVPVVAMLAQAHGLQAVHLFDDVPGANTDAYSDTDWVLVSANGAFLASADIREAAKPIALHKDWRLWTDDFNNLFQILK